MESKTDPSVLQFIDQYGEDAVLIWQPFTVKFYGKELNGRFAPYNETEEESLREQAKLRYPKSFLLQMFDKWNTKD